MKHVEENSSLGFPAFFVVNGARSTQSTDNIDAKVAGRPIEAQLSTSLLYP